MSEAWNKFVLDSDPEMHVAGTARHSAALALRFLGQVNNGGYNAFLTHSYEFGAGEFIDGLRHLGADKAALELEHIVLALGVPLPRSTQDERWDLLEVHWPDHLNDIDMLGDVAEKDLMAALERHVAHNERFYLGFPSRE